MSVLFLRDSSRPNNKVERSSQMAWYYYWLQYQRDINKWWSLWIAGELARVKDARGEC